MASPTEPPKPPGIPAAGRRWTAWVFLAMAASTALIWVLRDRPPAPLPPPPPLPPGWTRITVGDGVSVDLPGEPTKSGPVETANGGSDTSWACVVNGYTYGARRQAFGFYPADPNPRPDDLLDGFCDGLMKSLEPGGQSWRAVTVAGRPGREMRYRDAKAASLWRFVQIDRTLYFFLVGAPAPDGPLDGPDVTRFLASVRAAR